mmetsp:Transcript_30545/g.47853  ORF Transcript_30545/g.47853 Transcript_30545/m.47853 type:complete len:235 (+) Transcript_30545:1089-1793(+)
MPSRSFLRIWGWSDGSKISRPHHHGQRQCPPRPFGTGPFLPVLVSRPIAQYSILKAAVGSASTRDEDLRICSGGSMVKSSLPQRPVRHPFLLSDIIALYTSKYMCWLHVLLLNVFVFSCKATNDKNSVALDCDSKSSSCFLHWYFFLPGALVRAPAEHKRKYQRTVGSTTDVNSPIRFDGTVPPKRNWHIRMPGPLARFVVEAQNIAQRIPVCIPPTQDIQILSDTYRRTVRPR